MSKMCSCCVSGSDFMQLLHLRNPSLWSLFFMSKAFLLYNV